MNVRDYFFGRAFSLRSPFNVREAARLINDEAGSGFWPFSFGVVGGVWGGVVRLRYRNSPFEYNAKPILAGRLQPDAAGSRLQLRYRAPLWTYPFFVAWYFLLGSLALIPITGQWTSGISFSDKLLSVAIWLILIIAPWLFHYFGTRKAEEELEAIIGFLEANVQADG